MPRIDNLGGVLEKEISDQLSSGFLALADENEDVSDPFRTPDQLLEMDHVSGVLYSTSEESVLGFGVDSGEE